MKRPRKPKHRLIYGALTFAGPTKRGVEAQRDAWLERRFTDSDTPIVVNASPILGIVYRRDEGDYGYTIADPRNEVLDYSARDEVNAPRRRAPCPGDYIAATVLTGSGTGIGDGWSRVEAERACRRHMAQQVYPDADYGRAVIRHEEDLAQHESWVQFQLAYARIRIACPHLTEPEVHRRASEARYACPNGDHAGADLAEDPPRCTRCFAILPAAPTEESA